MYYYGMSKEDIMHSSRPFLYRLYSKYVKRACENLGVSPSGEEDEVESNESVMLRDEDYPTDFHRITDMDRKETMSNLTNDPEFMRQFGSFL